MNHRIYSNQNLSQLLDANELSDASKLLLELQVNDWNLCRGNYYQLNNVQVKDFRFDSYKIKAQYNPGRIISTSANVDPEIIRARKCFLCEENLPPEQKGIIYKNSYSILINPYPIFPIHLTLTNLQHQPQRIIDTFPDLLSFSKDLSKHFTVIYNGPRCGASAPDHLHFQAGNKFFMPIEDEVDLIANEFGNVIIDNNDIVALAVDDGLRKFLLLESFEHSLLIKMFNRFYEVYSEIINEPDEPLLNIISFFDNEYGWKVLIFLRAKHRSHHFFQEGENQILVSPAAIDLGGVCIFPREEDFAKINSDIISEIFSEVFIKRELLDEISNRLK